MHGDDGNEYIHRTANDNDNDEDDGYDGDDDNDDLAQRIMHSNLVSVHLERVAGQVATHSDQLPAVDLRLLEVLEVVAHGT